MGIQKTAFRCFLEDVLFSKNYPETVYRYDSPTSSVFQKCTGFDKTLGYKTDLKALEFHQDIEDSPTAFSQQIQPVA